MAKAGRLRASGPLEPGLDLALWKGLRKASLAADYLSGCLYSRLGYLTMLDKYMMACLSLLLGLAAGNAAVSTLDAATFTLSDRSRALFNYLCVLSTPLPTTAGRPV